MKKYRIITGEVNNYRIESKERWYSRWRVFYVSFRSISDAEVHIRNLMLNDKNLEKNRIFKAGTVIKVYKEYPEEDIIADKLKGIV